MESLNPAPYSAIADALNKFHSASEPIQALALVCETAMVLGTVWCVCEVLRVVVGRGATRFRPSLSIRPSRLAQGFVAHDSRQLDRVLRVSSRPECLHLSGRDQTT